MDADKRFSTNASALSIGIWALGALLIGIPFYLLFFDQTPRAYFDLTVAELNWLFLWVLHFGAAMTITGGRRWALGIGALIPTTSMVSILASMASVILLLLFDLQGDRRDITWSVLAQLAVVTGWLSLIFMLFVMQRAAKVDLVDESGVERRVLQLVQQTEAIELQLSRCPLGDRAGLLDALQKLRNRLQYFIPKKGRWTQREDIAAFVAAWQLELGEFAAIVRADVSAGEVDHWMQRLAELTLRIEQATARTA